MPYRGSQPFDQYVCCSAVRCWSACAARTPVGERFTSRSRPAQIRRTVDGCLRRLQDHWPVRAPTRNPDGKKARAIAQLGAEVVKADLADPRSLERALDGVHGVFSVQNHHLSGYEGEVRQGKQVAEVAKRVGASQLVYSGAGPGVKGSGVGSWETKLEVAAYILKGTEVAGNSNRA